MDLTALSHAPRLFLSLTNKYTAANGHADAALVSTFASLTGRPCRYASARDCCSKSPTHTKSHNARVSRNLVSLSSRALALPIAALATDAVKSHQRPASNARSNCTC